VVCKCKFTSPTSQADLTAIGTNGLGRETVLLLASRKPSKIFFTGRNSQAADALKQEVLASNKDIQAHFIHCDQSSLSSVRNAIDSFLKLEPNRLDILVCNAGDAGSAPGLTQDGYEKKFAVNYLSHALMTKLLAPLLEKTFDVHGDARVVNLSSAAFRNTAPGGIDFADVKAGTRKAGLLGPQTGWRYGQSKLASILYTQEAAKRYRFLSVAIHPGIIYTDIINDRGFWMRLLIKAYGATRHISSEEGAWNSCWAATMPRNEKGPESGRFYGPVGVPIAASKYSASETLQTALWKWTEDELNTFLSQK